MIDSDCFLVVVNIISFYFIVFVSIIIYFSH